MALNSENILDNTGWQILEVLQENARISFSELGRQVGLSAPAVAERVRRMEAEGIISSYRADIDPEKIGLPLMAMIELTTTPDRYPRIIALIDNLPVLECYHVTGDRSFVMKVIARSMSHLETIIEQLSYFGSTTTAVVLSSPLKAREISRNMIN
ncbi:MAG: Lrp/AsnC family transcriptional regulator [Cyanophyceae cyanobacterium]